tara:strand:+ start:248 stop:520 length:273 start_codon:yes stop_codon:yes gene_type:complete
VNIDIMPVSNGYVCEVWREEEEVFDEEPALETYVFEGLIETDDGKVECFERLLWWLNEEIGPTTDRHSAKRLTIGTEPGDKYLDGKDIGV